MEWNTKSFTHTELNGILTPKYDNEVYTVKKIKELSLILSGVVLGLGLSFSPQIYAATSSLLGSKVDKVITVKLDKVKLGDAIAIDGTSYLPIRSLSNALDVGVNYSSSEINLTSGKGDTTMEDVPTTPRTAEENAALAKKQDEEEKEKTKVLNDLNTKKSSLETKIAETERAIASNTNTTYIRLVDELKLFEERLALYPDNSELIARIESNKRNIAIWDKLREDSKEVLPTLQKELADLEAQLAALK